MKIDQWYKETDLKLIHSTICKYGIFDILFAEGKYRNAFVDYIYWTYKVAEDTQWTNSKILLSNSMVLRMAAFLIGVLRSIIFVYFVGSSKSNFDKRINAVSFAGKYNRFKHLNDLSDEPINIVYPPLYNFDYIKEHTDYFSKHGVDFNLIKFNFSDVFSLLCLYCHYGNSILKCAAELDEKFNKETKMFLNVYINIFLYKHVFERIVKQVKPNDKIWLMDYDFDPKFIMLNSVIKKHRPSDHTIHLQHGAFRGFNYWYCNPISDYSFCCCEREKSIIEEYNKYGSIIKVLGASLQSFDNLNENIEDSVSYNLLILLSSFEGERTKKQINLLKGLQNENISFVVRFRPASMESDRKILEDAIKKVSFTQNTTLREDVMKSKVVVSFSEDAIFECFRLNRKVLYICSEADLIYFKDFHSNNMMISDIKSLDYGTIRSFVDTYKYCKCDNDKAIKYYFGSFNFQDVQHTFNLLLSNI